MALDSSCSPKRKNMSASSLGTADCTKRRLTPWKTTWGINRTPFLFQSVCKFLFSKNSNIDCGSDDDNLGKDWTERTNMLHRVFTTGCWQSTVHLYPPFILQRDCTRRLWDSFWRLNLFIQMFSEYCHIASVQPKLGIVRPCLSCGGKGKALEATNTSFCILSTRTLQSPQ